MTLRIPGKSNRSLNSFICKSTNPPTFSCSSLTGLYKDLDNFNPLICLFWFLFCLSSTIWSQHYCCSYRVDNCTYIYCLLRNLLDIVDEIKGLYALFKRYEWSSLTFLKIPGFLVSGEEASYQNITLRVILVTVASGVLKWCFLCEKSFISNWESAWAKLHWLTNYMALHFSFCGNL